VLRRSGLRKGGSTVLQLALVLIAVIVAFYVAQHLLGITQEAPPPDEAIYFVNVTATRDAYMNWQILFYISNSGHSTVVLERIFVNNMEISEYSAGSPSETAATITTDLDEETDFESGRVRGVTVWIGGRFGFFNSGSVLDVKFVSSAGNEFVKPVILP
jgi:hypothetical protein